MGDSSFTQPLRSITHALSTIPSDEAITKLYAAPGQYADDSHRLEEESFPLEMRNKISLVNLEVCDLVSGE